MAYTVASEGFTTIESRSIRPGRRIAEGGKQVPSGRAHALDDESRQTACGTDPSTLRHWPDAWPGSSFLDHCRECVKALCVFLGRSALKTDHGNFYDPVTVEGENPVVSTSTVANGVSRSRLGSSTYP